MTHDELLARLDQLESYHISDPALNALRASRAPKMFPEFWVVYNAKGQRVVSCDSAMDAQKICERCAGATIRHIPAIPVSEAKP